MSSDTTCVPAFDSYARDVALTIDKIPSTIDASLVNDKLHITASLSQLKMELMDRGAILSHFFSLPLNFSYSLKITEVLDHAIFRDLIISGSLARVFIDFFYRSCDFTVLWFIIEKAHK